MSEQETTRADRLITSARAAVGFMPDEEGMALFHAAKSALSRRQLPMVEIGAYCGKSSLYLAAAISELEDSRDRPVLFSLDHHHGSEEMQSGWPGHEPSLVDLDTGEIDSLHTWRATIVASKAEDLIIGVVGDAHRVAAHWSSPLALVFIDGAHSEELVRRDYEDWSTHVVSQGLLIFHDVFAEPSEGGQGPYLCYEEAIGSNDFVECSSWSSGSLRVLEKR